MLLSVFAQDALFSPDDTCIISRPCNNESGGYGMRIGDFAIPPLIASVGFSAVFNHLSTVRGGMPLARWIGSCRYRRRGSRIIGVLSRWDANLGWGDHTARVVRGMPYLLSIIIGVYPAIYYLFKP